MEKAQLFNDTTTTARDMDEVFKLRRDETLEQEQQFYANRLGVRLNDARVEMRALWDQYAAREAELRAELQTIEQMRGKLYADSQGALADVLPVPKPEMGISNLSAAAGLNRVVNDGVRRG